MEVLDSCCRVLKEGNPFSKLLSVDELCGSSPSIESLSLADRGGCLNTLNTSEGEKCVLVPTTTTVVLLEEKVSLDVKISSISTAGVAQASESQSEALESVRVGG